ncbi:transcription initiation factor TFIID subunit 6 [Paracoccidioides lutzii Pb01]|uniref:TBP-associated factor 6 n=1 Tax=Paracoccidioides lutzii (strain ATCC MYA-826 / Pb01) TaxID=502779 RepID=C1H0I3_PARBA|nr:transcription initiation factor TFIID subunit 6 [Paracoccidioides lutzii Pb01]EEH33224.1 transcription initiation factor TFIID subunit 6 [Paracoccidioides lutzii Pb01]
MSVWNPENIRDVAESVGIGTLNDEVVDNLARDVEYRISQVLEEALKFMRHAKRTVLTTQDVSNALRVLDIEPLYGYESTRPLRFGEATLGPGQPLFYVEDDEVDFEKLINAPLPRVPREITFTAHWLAVEGVQPTIPQNPTSADSRNLELVSKGPNANANLAAMSGNDNVSVKPLVKHILSKELQLYFEKVCNAFLDELNEEYRLSAFSSLKEDPGLHQLVPYFVQFISEKVTHSLKDLFVLTQIMHMTEALIQNKSLYVDPYVPSLIPPVLTCLIGRQLGSSTADPLEHFALRDLSASLINMIARKYSHSSHTLRPRLARTFLKNFLDPGKPLGTHYGAIIGLQSIGGVDVVRELVLPNLRTYEVVLKDAMGDEGGVGGGVRRMEAEKVLGVILAVLGTLVEEEEQRRRLGIEGAEVGAGLLANGVSEERKAETQGRLAEKVGEVVAGRILEGGQMGLANVILGIR